MLWQTQLNHRQAHRNTVLWSQSATCSIYSSPLVLCTCCQVNNHGEARRQEEEFFPPKKIWEPRKSRLRLLFKKLFFNKVYEYELLKTQCNFFFNRTHITGCHVQTWIIFQNKRHKIQQSSAPCLYVFYWLSRDNIKWERFVYTRINISKQYRLSESCTA